MSAGEAFFVFAIATAAGLTVAWYDLRTLTIPNWLTGGLFILFSAVVLATGGVDVFMSRLFGASLVLVAGFLLFWAGQMGGGDAKAAAALTMLVAPVDAGFVLFTLALTGLLGLGALRLARLTPLARGSWRVWSEPGAFPYGVALGMTIILYTGLVAWLTP